MAPAEKENVIGDILKRQGLAKYIDEDIPKVMTEYDEIWATEDPEENPYRSKYKARKLLEGAVKEVEKLLADPDMSSDCDEANIGREMLARLFLYLGKNLYYCEEVANAELYFNRSLERYLRSPLRLQPNCFLSMQDLFNQLGMLWCHRYNHAEGMNFLRRAQIMFFNRPKEVRDTCNDQAENNYTLTMFYLAQAYGGLKKPGLSARFCAETMSRQLHFNTVERPKEALEKDPFDCKDWVRNCCSLSDFFANECMFWTAEYLLHSAALMCERCQEICGTKPENLDELTAEVDRDMGHLYSTRLKFAKTCSENPALCEQVWRGEREKDAQPAEPSAGTRLTFRCAADRGKDKAPEGGSGSIDWDKVFPEVVHLEDEEAADNKLAEETIATGEFTPPPRTSSAASGAGAAADAWLELGPDDRIRLPVHFGTLHKVVERRMRRANTGFLRCRGAPALVEDLLPAEEVEEADASGTAQASATPAEEGGRGNGRRMPSCIGVSFEVSREIFKLGNQYFMRALGYFLLDGWVTEHVRILQELSVMYRSLMFWEKDPKRAAAMLARRRQMLAPMLEHLNPRAYVAFYRQLSFEVAELIQELFELKNDGKLPGTGRSGLLEDDDDDAPPGASPARLARCNELARSSIKYYTTFVGTYHTEGKIPDKVEDDDTRVYLTAQLNTCRLSTKMKGLAVDEQVDWQKKALRGYEAILAYGERNPGVYTNPSIGMATEMRLCEEMAGMLPSKLSRIAARRR